MTSKQDRSLVPRSRALVEGAPSRSVVNQPPASSRTGLRSGCVRERRAVRVLESSPYAFEGRAGNKERRLRHSTGEAYVSRAGAFEVSYSGYVFYVAVIDGQDLLNRALCHAALKTQTEVLPGPCRNPSSRQPCGRRPHRQARDSRACPAQKRRFRAASRQRGRHDHGRSVRHIHYGP
jgi:hypothetical protein